MLKHKAAHSFVTASGKRAAASAAIAECASAARSSRSFLNLYAVVILRANLLKTSAVARVASPSAASADAAIATMGGVIESEHIKRFTVFLDIC